MIMGRRRKEKVRVMHEKDIVRGSILELHRFYNLANNSKCEKAFAIDIDYSTLMKFLSNINIVHASAVLKQSNMFSKLLLR